MKKRKISQIAVTYIVLSWVILQVTTVLVPIIEAPESASKIVLMLLVVGFPITLALAWAQIIKLPSTADDMVEDHPELSQRHENLSGTVQPSIAILPFIDLSEAGDQGYLGAGIAEEIIIALSRLENLRVVSRSAVVHLSADSRDIREIGQILGVKSLLEGSVRKDGERLRIATHLTDVHDGSHLWSQRYDRDLTDVFAIQDDISFQVATAVKGVLSSGELDRMQSSKTSIEAYTSFLKGRQLFHQLSTNEAKEMYESALVRDPGYAPAIAALADLFSWRYEWEGGRNDDLQAAEEYSLRALELAPELSESHSARAYVLLLGDKYEQAMESFEEAIRLNPESHTAYYFYARAAFVNGEIQKSAELFKKAARINLEDYSSLFLLGQSLNMIKPGSGNEAREKGLERAKKQLILNPTDQRAWSIGASSLMDLGRDQEALEWIQRALEIRSDDPSVLYNAACLYAVYGDEDRALDLLERYTKDAGNKRWIEKDPDLESLRHTSRFKHLMKNM